MPTVLRHEGFEFVIRPNDHDPPHVHVFKAGQQVKIRIGDDQTRPAVDGRSRMSAMEIRQALEVVGEQQDSLLAAWRRIHG